MLEYDFIGIEKQCISGVVNPVLTIQGSVLKENYDFVVLADDKEIEFDIQKEDENFLLTVLLLKTQKHIKVYVKVDNKKYIIYDQKNTMIKRFLSKIAGKIRPHFKLVNAIFVTLARGIKHLWKEYHFLVPPKLWGKYFKDFIHRIQVRGETFFYNPNNTEEYNIWLKKYEKEDEIIDLKYRPLISILIPVYNIERKFLSECIDSILDQTYDNFEICLVDDASTNKDTINTLKEYENKDKRIKVKYRKENGHISVASNDALNMAKGEFCALVDNDDLLSKNALYEVVKVLNHNKKIDFIYSDEDKIDLKGRRCEPHFKPDFSPDTLLSLNYICHLSVLRTDLMKKIDGFTIGLEGAQDHDLFLRISEITDKIYHIPKILYHWRMVKGSTALKTSNKSYANDKGKIAIENALKRRKIDATVEVDKKSGYYRVKYDIKSEPKVSIIIPTKDYADTLDTCLKSLYEKTTYKNYEVIVVNNNSVEKSTFDLFDKYKKKYDNFIVLDANIEFNYSKINNMAVDISKGEYIVLLNNDTEIITPEWLTIMVGYAMRPNIGAVGPKLLYPDKTVQHAGVILGLGGVASHAYIGSNRHDVGMYGRLRVPYDYSAVTAACLVVSKKKYIEVGKLEEELKVAYNDVDFNIKLLEKGYNNIFIPQVQLFHYESKSRGLDTTTEKYQRFLSESDYMWKKWSDQLNNDKYYNPNFSKKGWFVLDK
ncbi:MAG: glycosyltransferase [Bacilli bacterium]|nr:glycosyltransferase [Bacilli bacterium]